MALRPGDVLAGKYEIISEIGEGGFGKVLLGHDLGMDRPVAIKELLHAEVAQHPEDLADYEIRFRKEARIVSKFAHPNVVSAYALESDEQGNLYLISEYVGGGSLKNLLEAGILLDSEQAVALGIDICNAIEAIYRRDIVHRDIKPSNILVTEDGQAKLTDFGVAQLGHETRRTQTARGHPGTPAYKSPEQATTTGYLDERSDLYSLGLVLYEMLTGKLYVRNFVPPEAYNPDVSTLLSRIIMRVLEDDPLDRYQSATEMRDDLLSIQDNNVGTQIRSLAASANESRFVRFLVPVVLMAAVAVLVWGAIAIFGSGGAQREPTPSPTTVVAVAPKPTFTPVLPTATDTLTPTDTPLPSATLTNTPIPTGTPEPSATPTETPIPSETPALADGFEENDVNPSAIAVGETQTHNFYPVGDVDKVTFRSKPNRWYSVSTGNLAVGVDTRIEVWVLGERFENDDGSPGQLASAIEFRAPAEAMVVVSVTNLDQFGPDKWYNVSVVELPPTLTPTPTTTSTPTGTLPPTHTPTRTPTATGTHTFTPTPTWTWTPTITWTPTPTQTGTNTPTETVTLTPTLTETPPPTATDTLVPTATDTPIPTETDTPVPTDTPTVVPTETPTEVPTQTEIPTETSEPPPPTDTPTG